MTSPVLNLLISLGAVLLSISCFLFGLDFIVAGNLQGLSILCQVRYHEYYIVHKINGI